MKKYIKYLIVVISCIFSVSVLNVSASADELSKSELKLQYQVFIPLYAAPQNRLFNNSVAAIDSGDVADIVTSLIVERTFEMLGIEIPADSIEAIYHTFQYFDGNEEVLPDLVADVIVLIDDLYLEADLPEILVDYIVDTVFEHYGYYEYLKFKPINSAVYDIVVLFKSVFEMITANFYLFIIMTMSLLSSVFVLVYNGRRSVR